jgi:hypothetical protein
MKVLKSHIQLTSLVLSFVFMNAAFASEPAIDASQDDSTGNTTSHAAPVSETKDGATANAEAKAKTMLDEQQAEQSPTITDAQRYRQEMDERRRQVQQAQLEAYKRHLERRKQHFANNPAATYDNPGFDNNVATHIQQRRDEFIKQMEQRRAMNIKIMEQYRKDAEQRRKAMQLKMHKTCAPESVQKA